MPRCVIRASSVVSTCSGSSILGLGGTVSMGVFNSRRLALTVGCSALALAAAASSARAADFIGGDTLLISTTTYQDVGAVANLVAGVSQLPGSNAGQTSTAV